MAKALPVQFEETVIDLIRHGEPEGGPQMRGSKDDPLSELGWSQMRASVENENSWTHVVSSPLLRCIEFATELTEQRQLPLEVQSDFREIAFGVWEGLTTKEVMTRFPDAIRQYWLDPFSFTPEGGEGTEDFFGRVSGAVEALKKSHQGRHTLLVCHGGVIRAILAHVLEMPVKKMWSFDVPYANASRIVFHSFEDGTETTQLKFHQRRFGMQ